VSGFLVAAVLASGLCMAGPLDERTIVVQTPPRASWFVPLSLPYDGPGPTGRIEVVDDATGKRFPATVRDGQFVFVVEGLLPKATYRYGVKAAAEKRSFRVQVKKAPDAARLNVYVDGALLTSYHYSDDMRRPYLWPVLAEGGVPVTRDWPMGKAITTTDHEHHRSIWTAYGDLNGVDCWTEHKGTGYQHADVVSWRSGDAFGWIHAKNTWQDKDRKAVIDEVREYRFHATPAGRRLIDVQVTFSAAHGDVLFKDTKEGGIVAVRVRDELTVDEKGTITNSAGGKNESECWGKPAAWLDYSGPIEGVGVRGIAVFDHPGNLRHPTRWHARNYGLMAANCFGLGAFTNGVENGDYTLESGESLTFHYRILIHSDSPEAANVADRYADYAAPPAAAWAEE